MRERHRKQRRMFHVGMCEDLICNRSHDSQFGPSEYCSLSSADNRTLVNTRNVRNKLRFFRDKRQNLVKKKTEGTAESASVIPEETT